MLDRMRETTDGLGRIYVARFVDGVEASLVYVKYDGKASYLPSFFTIAGANGFLKSKGLQDCEVVPLTREMYELSRTYCSTKLGVALFLELNA